jgi:hypothetical protein
MATFITQHHDAIGYFLTAVVIPALFVGITLTAFRLDARGKENTNKTY